MQVIDDCEHRLHEDGVAVGHDAPQLLFAWMYEVAVLSDNIAELKCIRLDPSTPVRTPKKKIEAGRFCFLDLGVSESHHVMK
jgi:hypothetical protein